MTQETRAQNLALAKEQQAKDDHNIATERTQRQQQNKPREPLQEKPTLASTLGSDPNDVATATLLGTRYKGLQQDDHYAEQLSIPLLNACETDDDFFEQILIDVFADLETRVQETLSQYTGGTTVVCYLQVGDTLYVAGVGDSGLHVYQPGTKELTRLSVSHNPDPQYHPSEHKRTQAKLDRGAYRVASKKEPNQDVGRIAVSRSLGDRKFKYGSAEQQSKGLLATPDITCMKINEGDVAVLSSDGMDDVLTSTELKNCIESSIQAGPAAVATNLAQLAANNGTTDNTVVQAHHLKKLPRGQVRMGIVADGHGAGGELFSQSAVNNIVPMTQNMLHQSILKKFKEKWNLELETNDAFLESLVELTEKIALLEETNPLKTTLILIRDTVIDIAKAYPETDLTTLTTAIGLINQDKVSAQEWLPLLTQLEKDYGNLGKKLKWAIFLAVVLTVVGSSILFWPLGVAAFIGVSVNAAASAVGVGIFALGCATKYNRDHVQKTAMVPLYQDMIVKMNPKDDKGAKSVVVDISQPLVMQN